MSSNLSQIEYEDRMYDGVNQPNVVNFVKETIIDNLECALESLGRKLNPQFGEEAVKEFVATILGAYRTALQNRSKEIEGSSLSANNMRRKGGDFDGDGSESEDTQEASEVELRPTSPPPRRDHRHNPTKVHSELIAKLKRELQDLVEGRHPEYLRKVTQLEEDFERRLLMNKLTRNHAVELADREFVEEIKAAKEDFEEKDDNLKTSLVQFLEEKRRLIENDYLATMEQGMDVSDAKLPTRNLRRRALDSTPAQEKRRGKVSTAPCQISHLLDEKDIEDDLRAIARAKRTASLGANGIQTLGPFPSVPSDIKVEDGKLLYEKKWFHRGQTVYVEGRHMPKFPAVISNIASDTIHVKRTLDSSKVRINITQLVKGSVTIKRKAS